MPSLIPRLSGSMISSMLPRTAAAGFLLLSLTLACSSDSDDGGPRIPADIILVPNQPKIPQGLSVDLNATVVDASGREIRGQHPVLTSSDPSIVTINSAGRMTSVGLLGTVQITADLNGLTKTIDAQVTQRIVSLAVTPESLVINIGLSAQIGLSLIDFQGDPVFTTDPVTFESANTAVATVDQFGTVQAGNTAGNTTISVSVDTLVAILPVRVGRIPGQIIAAPNPVLLAPGATAQLAVTVEDVAGNTIPSPALTFSSSLPALFSVSGTGLVTSLAGGGSGAVRIAVENLEQDVGVFIGSATPVTLAHTTQIAGGGYDSDVGAGGKMVISAPGATNAVVGALPAFDLSTVFSTAANPWGVAVNHAGSRGYVASATKVSVIDLSNNTELTAIPVPAGDNYALAISSDDHTAYLGTGDKVYVLDLVGGQVSDSIFVGPAVFLALHPTLPRLYVSEGIVREVNLTDKTVRTFQSGGALKDLAISPDGSELYVADEGSGALRIFSTSSGQITQSVSVAGAFGVAASSKWIAVAGGGSVAVFDRASRFPISTVNVGGTPRRPAIDPGQTTIVVPNEAGWVDFLH